MDCHWAYRLAMGVVGQIIGSQTLRLPLYRREGIALVRSRYGCCWTMKSAIRAQLGFNGKCCKTLGKEHLGPY
jgi:hypothetical protein